MLSQPARPARQGRSKLVAALACLSIMALVPGCDKVPLLAPTGSVITIFPAATTVPSDGQIAIVATVIEQGVATAPATGTGTGTGTTPTSTTRTGAGTPVQNGTVVSFTTTIGRIEPREARTQNGEVRVKFIADGQSGTATITAYSGGASGTLENLRVGSAAVERVLITATPQTLGPAGGTSEIAARVEDPSGRALPGVQVNFVADAGTLSAASATSDSEGIARTRLTTSRPAKVTANVAGKTAEVTVGLNPRTGISIAGPTTPVSAGVPTTFTVNVASTANVTNVVVDFGDGDTQQLGAISGSTPVQHTYEEAGTYNVRATATEASGFSESVGTAVTILPGQPPSVVVTVSNNNPSVGEVVTVTATVSGNTSTILRYEWNFGAGAIPASATTTGNRTSVSWVSTGTKVITVTVFQATGPSGDGLTAVVVRP
jgi:hypothetical protein